MAELTYVVKVKTMNNFKTYEVNKSTFEKVQRENHDTSVRVINFVDNKGTYVVTHKSLSTISCQSYPPQNKLKAMAA